MTTYLIRGRGATMVKTAKAEKFKVKILDEDGFYKLIENSRTPASTTTVASSSKGEGKQSIPATTPVIQEYVCTWISLRGIDHNLTYVDLSLNCGPTNIVQRLSMKFSATRKSSSVSRIGWQTGKRIFHQTLHKPRWTME